MTFATGKVLGTFEIIELLGTGGMGEVYRAFDTKLGRQVAIKVLGVLAGVDDIHVMRFEREARVLASLDHPNIGAIYDFQEDDGVKFLVLQLVEGPTLSEQLSKGPLPLKEALLVFAQIAEALDAAHQRDIVHRDLKPANLKITPDARVKVLDFGLARWGGSDETDTDPELDETGTFGTTSEGQMVGTPAYMSPEQARGQVADKRSDIWSFGCILFETLSGSRPFKGSTLSDLVVSILRDEPDWSLLPQEVLPNIASLLKRCLEKEREMRLPDIVEARVEIDRALMTLSSPHARVAVTEEAPSTSPESMLKVMLFTNIIDAVDLKRRLGDQAGAELISRHDTEFRECLEKTGGSEIESSGDGFFCVFENVSDALSCALAFQRNLGTTEGLEALHVRMGIHLGEVVRLGRPVHDGGPPKYVGLAIDAASRITNLGESNHILLTRTAFDAARQQFSISGTVPPVQWLAHGSYTVQGLEEPVEIFEAGIAEFSPLRPPRGKDGTLRLVRPDEEETLGWRPAIDQAIPGREHWRLAEQLGEGGFGEVWLVRHVKTHEQRVFKFCFQAERVRALKHEVILFRLLKESLGDREDIARILDWRLDEAPYFIEAEFTSGGSLVDWARTQGGIESVPLTTRLEFAAQVAEALGAAHSVGVLHKDLKPANILIAEGTPDRPPRAVLTDFGIGLITDRSLLEEKGITSTGMGFTQTMFGVKETSGAGTRLYMAPEIIEEKPATTKSDIYSLGILLFQLVAGDLRRSLAPGWEREISDPLLREDIAACVEGSPDRRLSSAADLATRLRELEHRREQIESEKRTREEAAQARRLAEDARVRRRQYLLASIAGILVTLGVAGFAWRESRRAGLQEKLREAAELARTDEAEARVAAEASQALAETLRAKAEYAQYIANLQLATVRLAQGEKDLARELIDSAPSSARNWEWGYLATQAWPFEATLKKEPNDSPSSVSAAARWNQADAGVKEVLIGHRAFVVALDYSHDGKKLVTGSGDRTARVWDTGTGEPLQTFEGQSTILGVRFSHDDRLVAMSELVQNVSLWDVQSGRNLFTFRDSGEAIERLAFSPDDSLLASYSLNGTIRVWNTRTGESVAKIDELPPGRVPSLEFRSGQEVYAAYGPSEIRSWNVQTGQAVFQSAALSREGFQLAAICDDLEFAASRDAGGKVNVWEVETGREVLSLSAGPNSASASRTLFSPDHTVLVTLSDRHDIEFWDLESGRLLTTLEGYQLPDLGSVRMRADGGQLAVPDKDGNIQLLEPVYHSRDPSGAWKGHRDWVYLLRFSPDGRVLMSASYDHTLRLWDIETGQTKHILKGHGAEPGFAAFSPDGEVMLTGAWDGSVILWDVDSGESLQRLKVGLPPVQFGGGPRGPVFSVFAGSTPYRFFAPGSDRFIALTEKPNAAAVYERSSGKELIRISDEGARSLYPYILSPEGTHVLTVGYPSSVARLWDARSGEPLHALEGHQGILTHADFSPDGSRVATTSVDGTTKIWETTSGELLFNLSAHRLYSNNAHFSSSGRLLVTSSHDQTAKVWDVETGEEVASLVGHRKDVIHACFSPDETRVLTTGQDRQLKLWDLQGNELLTLGNGKTIYHAQWSPDGSAIAAGMEDGSIQVWRAPLWEKDSHPDSDRPTEVFIANWRM